MNTTTLLPSLLALGWAGALTMHAAPASALAGATPTPPHTGPVIVHDISYQGRLSDTEARFMATLNIESTNQVETILPLFQGDIAVSAESHPPLDQVPAALKLPDGNTLPEGLRLLRSGRAYHLAVAQPGKYNLKLEVLAKVTKTDPWRQVNFSGPAATLGKLEARVAGNGVELELLAGTALPRATNAAGNTPGLPIDAVRATPVRVSGVPSPRMRPVHHSPLHCSSCRRWPLRNARSPA